MRKMKRVAALLLVMAIGVPTAAMAQLDQILMLGVKKDAANTYQNMDLDGDWRFGSLGVENFQTTLPEGHSWWGTSSFDGATASETVDGTDYDSRTGSTNAYSIDGSYVVHSDGRADFSLNVPPRTGETHGYLSANRQYMLIADSGIWTSVTPNDIQMRSDILIKQSAGKTSADLNGTYHVRQMEIMEISSADRNSLVAWGTITFNAPNYSYSFNYYESDSTPASTETGSGTYDVAADGTVLIHDPTVPDAIGQLSSDGNVLFASIGRTDGTSRQNGLGVAIKAASGYSTASLAGDYYITVLGVHDMEGYDRDADLTWGAASFDGAGTFTITGMDEFYADGSTGHSTGSGTYSVDSDGEIRIIVDTVDGQPENVIFNGHLSSDGQLMALTIGTGTTDNPVDNGGGGGGGGGSSSSTSDTGGGGGGGGCFIQALE
jgi:hypothetical protein